MFNLDEFRDNLAALIADTDQLQAMIDYGRLQYKDDPEMIEALNETQMEANKCREAIAFAQSQIDRLSS
jgi:hypothetical protein